MIAAANVRKAVFCALLLAFVFLGGGGCGDGGGGSSGGTSCGPSSNFTFSHTDSFGRRLCTETRRTAGGNGLCSVTIRRNVPCP